MIPADSVLLEYAIKYAERGWFVFPCREISGKPFLKKNGKEKIPKVKSPYLRGGFKSATRDAIQIMDWWTRFPNAAIGVSCEPSNLCVIDIDVHKGDRRGFDNFMKMGVSDDGALHSLTASGGMHIIYSGLTNSEANVAQGVDLRSRGAYFIAPPSEIWIDGNKGKYVFLNDWVDRVPMQVPCKLVENLNLITGKHKNQKRKSKTRKK